MRYSPAGTTTSSGHSLKLSPGFKQRFSFPTCASTPAQDPSGAGFEGDKASSRAVAKPRLFC